MLKTATITDVSNLDLIIDDSLNFPLFVVGDPASNNQDIVKNMWEVSLDPAARACLSLKDLNNFVTSFLENRKQQLSEQHGNNSVIFYMWFDDVAAQLRFNVVSLFDNKLPFAYEVEVLESPESIFVDLLASQYSKKSSDEDKKASVLKLYIAQLNSFEHKDFS